MRAILMGLMGFAVLPVAGGLLARAPNVHVIPFSPARDTLRIHKSASDAEADFETMARAAKPSVAFNGTYYGKDGRPLGLLRSGGKWVFRHGHMHTAFVVDRKGRASVVSRAEVRRAPGNYPFAIAAGPRLLTAGKVTLNPEKEGFKPASRRIRAPRVALGVRRDGTGVVVIQDEFATLSEFAEECRRAVGQGRRIPPVDGCGQAQRVVGRNRSPRWTR